MTSHYILSWCWAYTNLLLVTAASLFQECWLCRGDGEWFPTAPTAESGLHGPTRAPVLWRGPSSSGARAHLWLGCPAEYIPKYTWRGLVRPMWWIIRFCTWISGQRLVWAMFLHLPWPVTRLLKLHRDGHGWHRLCAGVSDFAAGSQVNCLRGQLQM